MDVKEYRGLWWLKNNPDRIQQSVWRIIICMCKYIAQHYYTFALSNKNRKYERTHLS